MNHLFTILLIIGCSYPALFAQTTNLLAPGAPGADAHWPTAAKNGFGTANTTASKVWFTLADGVLTEVFYPTIDVPNVQTLQLIIVSPDGKVDTESDDTAHSFKITDASSPSFAQENSANSGAYVIQKTYATDPQRSTLLVRVLFKSWRVNSSDYALYVYYDPSLNNSGRHDSAWTQADALLAGDADKASALIAAPAFAETTSGYLESSDGLTQLRRTGRMKSYGRATDGNVVQVARLSRPSITFGNWLSFTLALGFGKTTDEAVAAARTSLAKGFESVQNEYQAGWHDYVARLPRVEQQYQAQFAMAAMVLKGLEDKTFRGAVIASPSTPWGGGPDANEPTISGYHAVWSRDLYHVATAFAAMGDRAAASRSLDYLFNIQQKADGSFPQNTWVDGRQIGGGSQMDETAFPIILAYQLSHTDESTWRRHIKPAADYIVEHGPATGQERWEEKSGYSPATIAAEIAGLVCAARIATINNDESSAGVYLKTADDWARNIERWTATNNGPYAGGHYYLRITENGNPNEGAKVEINSGGGTYDEREIVDAGFLELVRLGIKAADDPLIRKSLAAVDKLVMVETPGGAGWYRYCHDAYGERPDGRQYDGRSGVGRLWTLLAGERGEYELARGDVRAAGRRLDAMMHFANNGLMIPEQVWDRQQSPDSAFRFGAGTGSATPLAWSMAQFIRLAVSINRSRNLETPDIVADRYLGGPSTKR